MEPFLYRLLVAVLIVILGEKLIAVSAISPRAKQILTTILIIVAVLFTVFGSVLPLR